MVHAELGEIFERGARYSRAASLRGGLRLQMTLTEGLEDRLER